MASAAPRGTIGIPSDGCIIEECSMKASRSTSAAFNKRRLGSLCRLTLLTASALGIFTAGHVIGRWSTKGAGSIRLTIRQQPTAKQLSQPPPGRAEAQLLPSRQDVPAVSMHTVAMTNCNRFQDWQIIGLYWSFLRSGQPGQFTRLLGCNAGEVLHRPMSWPYPFWITSGISQVEEDVYPLYNKPWVLSQWMRDAKPSEEYFLVLDADMIIRRPFLPEDYQIRQGWAAAQNIWYLQDLNAAIAPELFPQLASAPRDDWDAHPGPGRVADEVAEFYFMQRDDARVMSQLYWQYTRPIRSMLMGLTPEDEARKNRTTGQDWVAETHAYPIAAAMANVRHSGSNSSIFHASHEIWDAAPNAIHYCWATVVDSLGWSWFKHHYREFDFTSCPTPGSRAGQYGSGMFPAPPRPSQLTSKGGPRARDLLSIEAVATLNQGFCHLHHLRYCVRTEFLLQQCAMADGLMVEIEEAWRQLEEELDGDMACLDAVDDCNCEAEEERIVGASGWSEYCRRSCGLCTPKTRPV